MTAVSIYDERYARRYRDRDEELLDTESYQELIAWLGDVCRRFASPIDVLDLGCGTGRYFWGVQNVASLVGLDASDAMLAEARHPIQHHRVATDRVQLMRGDLLTQDFEPERFDLIYSIGVLAEHVALDEALIGRVWRWLRPGGRFAFTTVHPASPSVRLTPARRLAAFMLPFTPGAIGRRLHRRLMAGGRYGDERWVRDRLTPHFAIESLERVQTDVHLHGRCVARKVAA